ncbi:caspase family protein [Parvicella tangerina]|nr:caspase family protein [Parvicella tangerina]
MRYWIGLLLGLIGVCGWTQKDGVTVQLPDKVKFSEQNYYDFNNNKIYSLNFNYGSSGVVIWDMWNMVPQEHIEVEGLYMPENGIVRFEPQGDSLFVYITGDHESYYSNPDTRLAISFKDNTVNTSKYVSENNKVRMERPYNFNSPNNSMDGSKGYQKVTGITLNENIKFIRNDSVYRIDVQNGNYINEFTYRNGEQYFNRYDDYTKITLVNTQSPGSGYYSTDLDTIFEFNTIAGAVHPSGSRLALLLADYSTMKVYEINEDMSLTQEKEFSLQLPDTSEFELVFPSDKNPEKIMVANLEGIELVDLKEETVERITANHLYQDETLLVVNGDSIDMSWYDRLLCVPLNEKYVEVFVYTSRSYYGYNYYHTNYRNEGSYLTHSDLIGFKNYVMEYGGYDDFETKGALSFIYDIENKKLVKADIDKLYGRTSLTDVFTLVNKNSTQCEIYDAKLDKVIKRLDLSKVVKSFNFSVASNSFDFGSFGNWYDQDQPDILSIFPFFSRRQKLKGFQYVYDIIVEKNATDPAFFVTQMEADPGLTVELYSFIADQVYKQGSHSEGEYSYSNVSNYRFSDNTKAFDIDQSSENDYYFLEDLVYYGDIKDSIAQEVGSSSFVFLSRYTDTNYVHDRVYPGFSYGRFSKEPDHAFLMSSKHVMKVNYLTGDTLLKVELASELMDNYEHNHGVLTSDEKYFAYLDTNYAVRHLNLEKGTEKILLELPGEEIKERGEYMFDYAFSQNGDYFGFEDRGDLKNLPPSFVISTVTGEEVIKYTRPTEYFPDGNASRNEFVNGGCGMCMINNDGIPIIIDKQSLNLSNSNQVDASIQHFVYVPTADTAFSMMSVADHWLVYLPEGYYFGEPEAVEAISFKKGDEVYPYTQFDHFYNRPDKVMQAVADYFGVDNEEGVKMLHKAYEKRLEKLDLGIMEELPEEVPELKIINKQQLPYSAKTVDLDLSILSAHDNLKDLTILVNDVPVERVDLSKKSIQQLDKTFSVELMKGFNLLEVFCRDQSGTPSMPQYVTIYGDDEKVKEELYVVAIGAGSYQDEQFNLKYAAKDAQDFANTLTETSRYGEVHKKVIVNEAFTVDKMEEIKSFLAPAKINDEIILFIAGHGVLDENLDYYLATHDMNFSNPSENGLSYDKLEAVLDGVKPLKKTLMLDACHSGEIDKEEVELMAANNTEVGNVQFRAVGHKVTQRKGMQNVSELTKSMFNDLRVGTGATIISAAGGMEFAMERGDLKNGLFTYCFIDGIRSGAADLNKDGEIWLKEMQEYLQDKVSELSQGKQQPTSRIVNNIIDYRIW